MYNAVNQTELKDAARFLLRRLRQLGIVPTELTQIIEQEKSLDRLTEWFDAACMVQSIQSFEEYVTKS